MSLLSGVLNLVRPLVAPKPPEPPKPAAEAPKPEPPKAEAPKPGLPADRAPASTGGARLHEAATGELPPLPFPEAAPPPPPPAVESLAVGSTDEAAAPVADVAQAALTGLAKLAEPERRTQAERLLAAARASDAAGATQGAEADATRLLNGDLLERHPDLLGRLDALGRQELDKRVREADPQANARLVAEALRQIVDPKIVAQDPDYNTCGEAAIERRLVASDPARYVETLRQLVSKDERAHLGDWAVSLNARQSEDAMDSRRSLASTYFQQSVHAAFRQGYAESALTAGEFDRMIQQAFPAQRAHTFSGEEAQGRAMALLKEGVGPQGTVCMIGTDPAHLHAVTVTDVDAAGGRVTFSDPNGNLTKMDAAIFEANLHGMVGHPDRLPPDEKLKGDIGEASAETTAYTSWQPSPTTRGRR